MLAQDLGHLRGMLGATREDRQDGTFPMRYSETSAGRCAAVDAFGDVVDARNNSPKDGTLWGEFVFVFKAMRFVCALHGVLL